MKVLVTGGAGYIGSHVVLELLDQGFDVSVLDDLSMGARENVDERAEFFLGSILNPEDNAKALEGVDAVIHMAAFKAAGESVENPEKYEKNNVGGTLTLLGSMLDHGIHRFVFSSSAAVYGDPQYLPVDEKHPVVPINPYGQTKLDNEYLFEKYSNLGVSIIGLRYFNIFGKGQTLAYSGVITKFLDRISKSDSPVIFGDGSQIRDFIFVGDVVKANLAAMENKSGNFLINIGSGKAISILQLANMMIDSSGLSLQVTFQEPLEGDVRKSHANIDLANKLLKWEPKMELKTWLDKKISDGVYDDV